MKAAFLSASASRLGGGLYFSVRGLAKALVLNDKMEVDVFSVPDEKIISDLDDWDPVKVKLYNSYGPWSYRYAPGMMREVVEGDYDLVHTHHIWMYPSVVARKWAQKTGRPYVISPRGMLDPWAVRNSQLKKKIVGLLFENAHLQNASCVHALCDAEFKAIRQYGLKSPVCIIPNGVDLPSANIVGSPPWDDFFEPGRKILLYIGRLHPKKGLENLISAFDETKRLGAAKDWVLVIGGWGSESYRQKLESLAEKSKYSNDIRFSGPLYGKQKELALAHASAFVLPSESEGLPVAVLEAWAYGLPTLITEQCNLSESAGEGASIVVKSSTSELAQGLETLFCMPEGGRIKMGAAGVSLVKRRYTWEKVAEQMYLVYKWVLGEGAAPSCVVTGQHLKDE